MNRLIYYQRFDKRWSGSKKSIFGKKKKSGHKQDFFFKKSAFF